MNPLQLLTALGDFASIIFAVVSTILVVLIWKIYTNHLPHIYSELRSMRQEMQQHDRWERNGKH